MWRRKNSKVRTYWNCYMKQVTRKIMCSNIWLIFYSEWSQSQVAFIWQLSLETHRPADLKTCPMDEPCCCSPCESLFFFFFYHLSISLDVFPLCSLSVPLLFYFYLISLLVLLIFHPVPNLFILLLSTFSLSLSIPTVDLMNKCIIRIIELIHRSFISAPYGPTVKPHKVFKVIALQQISVYCRYFPVPVGIENLALLSHKREVNSWWPRHPDSCYASLWHAVGNLSFYLQQLYV